MQERGGGEIDAKRAWKKTDCRVGGASGVAVWRDSVNGARSAGKPHDVIGNCSITEAAIT